MGWGIWFVWGLAGVLGSTRFGGLPEYYRELRFRLALALPFLIAAPVVLGRADDPGRIVVAVTLVLLGASVAILSEAWRIRRLHQRWRRA